MPCPQKALTAYWGGLMGWGRQLDCNSSTADMTCTGASSAKGDSGDPLALWPLYSAAAVACTAHQ